MLLSCRAAPASITCSCSRTPSLGMQVLHIAYHTTPLLPNLHTIPHHCCPTCNPYLTEQTDASAAAALFLTHLPCHVIPYRGSTLPQTFTIVYQCPRACGEVPMRAFFVAAAGVSFCGAYLLRGTHVDKSSVFNPTTHMLLFKLRV